MIVKKRTPKNGTLTQLISFLDGSYWKNLLDYFDLRLDSFRFKGEKLNFQDSRVKWGDVLAWVYRNFMFIAIYSWFTSMCREARKCVTAFKERFRIFFSGVRNKNYFENLSNLRALIVVNNMNLLLII